MTSEQLQARYRDQRYVRRTVLIWAIIGFGLIAMAPWPTIGIFGV